MFKIEIIDLQVRAKIGVSSNERKKNQLLKISLKFEYNLDKNKNIDNINNLKDYSDIVKFLKSYVQKSNCRTLEKLITKTAKEINNKFKIKKIKIKINKTEIAKKYGCESLSVSN